MSNNKYIKEHVLNVIAEQAPKAEIPNPKADYTRQLQKEFPNMTFIDPTDNPSQGKHFNILQDINKQQWEHVLNVIRDVKAKSKEITVNTFYHTDGRPIGLMQHQNIGMLADQEKSMFSNKAISKFLENHDGLGKNKNKADYKNKAYKNNAKKAKPSSILLGLIKNNNK